MGNYEKAYQRYKSSILSFKEHLARPFLEQKIIKILKRG